MNRESLITVSTFISLILRHHPETIECTIDTFGWLDCNELIQGINKKCDLNFLFTKNDLIIVVESNNKKRFTFNNDMSKIRANQGHSINVDLELESTKPPSQLFHGTAAKNIDSIKKFGILKAERNHVHLSLDYKTALSVGIRYGKPIVLKINSEKMYRDGIHFYQSKNGVWLTHFVNQTYILQ